MQVSELLVLPSFAASDAARLWPRLPAGERWARARALLRPPKWIFRSYSIVRIAIMIIAAPLRIGLPAPRRPR